MTSLYRIKSYLYTKPTDDRCLLMYMFSNFNEKFEFFYVYMYLYNIWYQEAI